MKTNNLYIILVIALTAINSFAQAPNYLWARRAGANAGEGGNGVAADSSGNIFITGGFTSFYFVLGTTTLTNQGNGDMYIVKYDSSGNVLWAKSAGGTSSDLGYAVSTDAGGNVIVTGDFESPSIVFDSITLTNPYVSNSDIFIVKYDSNGNVLWAKSAGGYESDVGNSIFTDTGGNIFVTGYFASSTLFFGVTTLTNAGVWSGDMFIVKLDSNGNELWAKSAGGDSHDNGNSVTIDASGNVFVTGSFSSDTITFDSTTLSNSSGHGHDIFIVKYDSSGNALWAKRTGGSSDDYGSSVFCDASGNSIVTGWFTSSSITFGATTLTNAGIEDMFIVKYDSNGNPLWAKRAGGSTSDEGISVTSTQGGNIFVTGTFRSTAITFGTTTLTNAGTNTGDIFIAEYDSSGNILWADRAGDVDDDMGRSIYTAANGDILVSGAFESYSITFGAITLTNATTAETNDMFIVNLSSISTGIDENYFTKAMNVYPNPFSSQTVLLSDASFHNATLTVDNYLGQTVAQIKNLAGKTITFNRGNLQSGLYFVRVTEDDKIIAIKKLVITD